MNQKNHREIMACSPLNVVKFCVENWVNDPNLKFSGDEHALILNVNLIIEAIQTNDVTLLDVVLESLNTHAKNVFKEHNKER